MAARTWLSRQAEAEGAKIMPFATTAEEASELSLTDLNLQIAETAHRSQTGSTPLQCELALVTGLEPAVNSSTAGPSSKLSRMAIAIGTKTLRPN